MEIEVLQIEGIDHPKILGLATIQINNEGNFIRIAGLKIMKGNRNIYCCCPSASFVENGLRKWSAIVTFSQKLWEEIQGNILKKYEEKERGNGSKKTRGIN